MQSCWFSAVAFSHQIYSFRLSERRAWSREAIDSGTISQGGGGFHFRSESRWDLLVDKPRRAIFSPISTSRFSSPVLKLWNSKVCVLIPTRSCVPARTFGQWFTIVSLQAMCFPCFFLNDQWFHAFNSVLTTGPQVVPSVLISLIASQLGNMSGLSAFCTFLWIVPTGFLSMSLQAYSPSHQGYIHAVGFVWPSNIIHFGLSAWPPPDLCINGTITKIRGIKVTVIISSSDVSYLDGSCQALIGQQITLVTSY